RGIAVGACYSHPAVALDRVSPTATGSSHMRSLRMTMLASVLAVASVAAQSGGARPATIPQTVGGKPDFPGYWNLPYVPNMAAGKEADVPYTERGRRAFEDHDAKDDPTANCWYPGVPRIMQSPYPVQFIQTKDYFVMTFEYMRVWRVV